MLISEKAHFTVFLIGIIIMLGGVVVIAESTTAAPYVMFTGSGMAVAAMISQTIKWLRIKEI